MVWGSEAWPTLLWCGFCSMAHLGPSLASQCCPEDGEGDVEGVQLQPRGAACTQQCWCRRDISDWGRGHATGLCTQGGDVDGRLSHFHPAAFGRGCCGEGWGAGEGELPPHAELRQTRSVGSIWQVIQCQMGICSRYSSPAAAPARTASTRRGGHVPAGTVSKPPPGGGAGWHGWVAPAGAPRGAQVVLPGRWGSDLGTGSVCTELAEHTSPCLAGQGLKLGLGAQNLANELMAIN